VPPGTVFAFGPFQLEIRSRRLLRSGESVPLGSRQFDLLQLLVSKAGQILSKDALIEAAWPDVAVTDNSLEQAISGLRRLLGSAEGPPYIETAARRGYRFAADVTRHEDRETDDALETLLAPHRMWIEGRAALETLEKDQIAHARDVFERVIAQVPGQAPAQVGLANAFAMQFEMTRTDAAPDRRALELALHHAREACRLDAQYGEAWATLGFVLDRTGDHADALAALRRAVALEGDNWRHHFRLSYAGWGEERLREAGRTLALLPGFPLAHWLAASVHVAREALTEAERELASGIAAQSAELSERPRFSGIALHWLLGLIHLARGDEDGALHEFDRELAHEGSGHLYARECCANTWYAIGAVNLRRGRWDAAAAAFEQAIGRLPIHPMARAGLAALSARGLARPLPAADAVHPHDVSANAIDGAMARAGYLIASRGAAGQPDAARLVDSALTATPAGNAGWLLPIEPLLGVQGDRDAWAPTLARLRIRAA
jgi:DNA-binding winged helix-turn-helix (wHTH) protein